MDAQTYINQLKEYSMQFEIWWCKPFEEFHKNYQNQNRSFISRLIPIKIETSESAAKFHKAIKQFEGETRDKYDLIEEIFKFLDENYEIYLHANIEQRIEIRSIVKNRYYSFPKRDSGHYMGHYIGELILKYIKERAIKNLTSTSDNVWLNRGLVAISIENSTVSKLVTLTLLADLYVTSTERKISPELYIQEIANISDDEMKEMMTNIGSTKIVYERREVGYVVYRSFYDNP